MKLAIQGDVGSACEMAGQVFAERLGEPGAELVYRITAAGACEAVLNREADYGVFAVESPLGEPIEETTLALAEYRSKMILKDSFDTSLGHVIIAKTAAPFESYRTVVSHEIPLAKHTVQLRKLFPNADFLPTHDTGLAARMLSLGELSPDAVVIALPSAAKAFGLTVIVDKLHANEGYLTRFELLSI